MNTIIPAMPAEVAAAFSNLPTAAADRLIVVRRIAFTVAAKIPQTGGLHEYLAWGQPAYRPVHDGVGTAVRLGIHGNGSPAMFVHCGTSLLAEFRQVAGHLEFDGRRAVLLPAEGPLPENELHVMIEHAFTSKYRKNRWVSSKYVEVGDCNAR